MTNLSKKYNKFIATSVAATVVATGVAPVAGFAAADKFSDVKGHWSVDAVDYLVGKGAISGYADGTFKPDGQITRAEAATMLAATLNLSVDKSKKTNFTDAKNHWASSFIAAIQDQLPGVIGGYEDGSFRPDRKITRQEMAKMITAAYGFKLNEDALLDFKDNNSWGKESVNVLASLGIVVGQSEGKFVPEANVTRGETATFIHRAEVEEVRKEVKLKEVKLAIDSVKAVTPEKVEVAFNKEIAELDRADVAIEDENNDRVFVKAVELAEDGLSATIELYDDLKDETSYDVTVKAGKESLNYKFDFELGEVNEILTSSATINPSEDHEIQYKVITDTGVDVTEDTKVTFNATKNVITDGVIKAGKLSDGESVFVEIIAGDVKSKRIKITANASKATKFEAFTVTAEPVGDLEDWKADDFEADHDIALGQTGLKLDTLFLDQYGEQAAGTVKFESLSPNVLVVDEVTGALTPRRVGTADVKVTNGDVSKVVTIKVLAEAKFNSLEIRDSEGKAITRLAMNPAVDRTETVTVQLLDQYGEDFTGEETLKVEVKGDSIKVAGSEEKKTVDGAVKLTLNHVNGKTGTTTITVKNEAGNVVKSLRVSIEEAGEIADYKLEGLKDIDLYHAVDNDDDTEAETTLKLFPVDDAGVKTSGAIKADWVIENKDGEEVASHTGTATTLGVGSDLDVEGFEKGLYTLKVIVGDLVVVSETFNIVDSESPIEVTQTEDKLEVDNTTGDLFEALKEAVELTQDGDTVAVSAIDSFSVVSNKASVIADNRKSDFTLDADNGQDVVGDTGSATIYVDEIVVNGKSIEVDFEFVVTVADLTAPSVDSIALNENDKEAETLTITVSEALDLTDGAKVEGFETSNGTIASAKYDADAKAIVITSSKDGEFTAATTVSYEDGNVVDEAGNEMANFEGKAVQQ